MAEVTVVENINNTDQIIAEVFKETGCVQALACGNISLGPDAMEKPLVGHIGIIFGRQPLPRVGQGWFSQGKPQSRPYIGELSQGMKNDCFVIYGFGREYLPKLKQMADLLAQRLGKNVIISLRSEMPQKEGFFEDRLGNRRDAI